MKSHPSPHLVHRVLLALVCSVVGTAARVNADDEISFNREVRPVLASQCFACHGPDEEHREADLRLDVDEAAIEHGVIEPGDPDASELVRRLFSSDEDEVMPPPHAGTLKPEQKQLLRDWVQSGAKYDKHWAFTPPTRPAVPTVTQSGWARGAIDAFVLDRLAREGISPSPEADRMTLVRRLYIDLIGLPPTPEQADAFVSSTDPHAYEALVDELLQSPRYGEHWALPWLDLARYADTNGYEKDRERSIWPYRDWVIRALNEDMPYDEFSIKQLAGDLLPRKSPDDLIATGFHRNTMLNEEGGIDPLEYRYLAMVDRVATTGVVWLGLTTGCAQCHTHKFDPITHTDYFRLMALLNNADEPDYAIPDPTVEQQRRETLDQIERLESQLADVFPIGDDASATFESEFAKWIRSQEAVATPWQVITPTEMKSNLPRLELLDDGSVFASGDTTKRDEYELTFTIQQSDLPITAIRLEALPDDRLPEHGPGLAFYEGRKGDFFVSELNATLGDAPLNFGEVTHNYRTTNDGNSKVRPDNVFDGDGSTGWQPGNHKGERLHLVMNLQQPIETPGELRIKLLFERHYVASLGRFRFAVTSKPDAVASQLSESAETILASAEDDKERSEVLRREFLRTTPLLAEARKPIDSLRAKLPEPTTTLVMQERPADHPRPTYRHHRGEYLSPKEQVSPGMLSVFVEDEQRSPKNRLEMARWLVSDANPLIARVTVNRAWRSLFGAGLVRSSDDFGVQSEPPTHPELLDWLSVELIENGWSIKQLHKWIVMSETYRQDSKGTAELVQMDPDNRLLARGARFRVNGETVRDIMLRGSGLLSEKMYGPGVFPPQPPSVTELAYGNFKWNTAKDADRYRRSIYTFKKRTAAFAAYTVFDAPTGEECIPQRNRSNTPLQALTVLNDEMYFEMARALAEQTLAKQTSEDANDSPTEIATSMFRRILTRPPTIEETQMLTAYFDAQKQRLVSGQLIAAEIGGDKNASADFAAWSMVARVIMNLDEAVTRP
ncbi:PSD1 and planctomycete cytochrome C domain-containing protein [Novipirellula caenicola]|uniref:Planctomycete cytochrome C n=1 Tax=Novipirellula caenicola TaxID=1536901 RepID=A0ABP9VZT1_9BACT